MKIEEYLDSVTAYDVPDNTIEGILIRRKITSGSDIENMSDKDIDLSTADVYMWCASTPSAKHATEQQDGMWKEKKGGWSTSAYDKRELRAMARELYDKWGETVSANRTKVRIVNF